MLLLNLGGPETLDDVQPFLYNLFADPDIIRLPSYAKFLQPVVAQVCRAGTLLHRYMGDATLLDDHIASSLPCARSMTQNNRSLLLTVSILHQQVISSLRAPKSSEGYRAIGGGSPLRKITLEQADALQEALGARGQPASVYVAMRYWKPFTEDAVAQVGSWVSRAAPGLE